jgi:tetratricopeptide (TPR) repeat protein
MKRLLYRCALAFLLAGGTVRAHEGPEHDIEELTDRMKVEGESAHLLLERAVEYQVIRKHTEAVKDLEKALRLEPRSAIIQRELGRAYFSTGKTNEALQTVTKGLEQSLPPGVNRAALLALRGEILKARKETQKALDDTNQAIQEHPDNLEWYLLRGQLQTELGLKKERVSGLEEGIKHTGAAVLQIEWVEALIDDNQNDRALERIEQELNSSRLQSSWLIRRAKVRLAAGQGDAAKADLQKAVTELNARISSSAPDASLLVDRGVAYDLLGMEEKALKDFVQARDRGIQEPWLLARIAALRKTEDGEPRSGRGSRRGRRSSSP